MANLEQAEAGKTQTKNMVLRLDPDLAELLATVAEVEGRSVSDVAREAIAALVQARRKDKRFRRLLEDNLARHQRLLDLLRGRPAVTVLDAADLVVIAARTLGIGSDAALAAMDLARRAGRPGRSGPARARARCDAARPRRRRRGRRRRWCTPCCGTVRSRGRTSRSRSRPGCSSCRSTGGGPT